MNRPVHALVLGLTFSLLAAGANASPLEVKGSPTPNVAAMPSYGMDVPTRMGLKTVIPAEWQLFVHRTVTLPETMNWNRGEAWPAVLTKFASDNQMAVLIDWDNHVVMLRSPEQALEEGATRQEITQAATTPLPKFEDSKPRIEVANAPLLAHRVPDSLAPRAAAVTALPTFNVATAPDSARTTAVAQPAHAPGVAQAPTAKAAVNVQPNVQAEAAAEAKLASLQKAQAEESSKLALAQKAREAEASKLVATQQAREAEATKLAAAQQAHVAEAAKLAGVQKSAQDEAAKLAELKKAREAEAEKLALAQSATKAAVVPMPVIRVNPTPAMVAAQQSAAATVPAVKLASTSEFAYTEPVALNRPSARKVAQAIADRFDLRLVYAADEFTLPGPVTLLAQSPSQDAQLLERAVGRFGPVVLEVDAAQKVIRVVPRNASPQQLADIRSRRAAVVTPVVRTPTAPPAPTVVAVAPKAALMPASGVVPVVAAAPVPMTPVAVKSVPAPVIVQPIPQPRIDTALLASAQQPAPVGDLQMAKPAADTALTLDIAAKQPLEDAVARLARTQGYTVEWKVSGGFDANRSMSFTGRTLRDVLVQVLPKLALSADINTREKHIVVRPADAARDR